MGAVTVSGGGREPVTNVTSVSGGVTRVVDPAVGVTTTSSSKVTMEAVLEVAPAAVLEVAPVAVSVTVTV